MIKLFIITQLLLNVFAPVATNQSAALVLPVVESQLKNYQLEAISTKVLSLKNRNSNKQVNDVFADNIILNLHYIKGDVDNYLDSKLKGEEMVSWTELEKPFNFTLTLPPGQIFTFHDDVLPKYEKEDLSSVKTSFSYDQGYKQVDGLYGNGVCHLASLINWTASTSGLAVEAPTNHNFAPVPAVPNEYGTAILYMGGYSSQLQNLYIKNTYDYPVHLLFDVNKDRVVLTVLRDLT